MKVAVINDTHFGVRNDSMAMLQHQEKFYSEVFFPTLEEQEIKHILHLGDLFDRRKYINFNTLSKTMDMFIKPIKDLDIEMHLALGNHDVYYKNTNEINSVGLILSNYDKIHVYEHQSKELDFGNTKVMMCPWITLDNRDKIQEQIKNTNATILMGHFEFSGFEMLRGIKSSSGLNKDDFRKFYNVYSGHFHHPSTQGNIVYLGAPYEMTWSDYDGKRGFHIFDAETLEMEHIPNPFRMFNIIEYNDEDLTLEDIDDINVESLTNSYVKIKVNNKNNSYMYDLFLEKIQSAGVSDLKIDNTDFSLKEIETDETIEDLKGTYDILKEYVDNIETSIDKVKIQEFVHSLYQEAMTLD